jgi:hypothetical protein
MCGYARAIITTIANTVRQLQIRKAQDLAVITRHLVLRINYQKNIPATMQGYFFVPESKTPSALLWKMKE